jgi:excisionase family DNA binding protein
MSVHAHDEESAVTLKALVDGERVVASAPSATTEDVANVLRLSRSTVRRKLVGGELHGFRVGSGPKAHWRVSWVELERVAREGVRR